MKVFVAVILLVAYAQAIDISKLKPLEVRSPPLFPKYTGAKWEEIRRNQRLSPVSHSGFKPGTKPQPVFAGLSRVHPESRIVGGSEAKHGQFPWQALINMDNSYVCGGSLISKQWILTAGHCAYQFESFLVILGAQDIRESDEDGRITVTTTKQILHEDYDPYNIKNDISLLKLPEPVAFSAYVNMVQLPPRSMMSENLVGKTVTVSGWGKDSDDSDSISPVLRFVQMPVMSNDDCANVFGETITSTNICTDTKGGHSACNGDSGGPLTLTGSSGQQIEVGIVSFGSSAGCEKGYPAVFTRVTEYLDWIENNSGIAIQP